MHSFTRVAALTCGVILTLSASAQSTDEDSDSTGLSEIVVTASKTGDQSLQSVPITIQAFGEDELKKGIIQGFDDYSKLVAGLSSVNKGPDQTQIIIRGITAGRISHAEPQNQSTSGLYVDEIPVSTNGFNPDIDLFDVQRIEVLKGPQGTLFGAGAMSGAIRIITNDVDLHQTNGAASINGEAVDHGSVNYAAHAMMNVPLLDDVVGVRASAFYDHDGGYINNVYDGRKNYNAYRKAGGALKGRWDVNDQFNLRASFIYQELNADGRPQAFSPLDDAAVNAVNLPGQNFTIGSHYETLKFTPDPFHDKYWLMNLLANYSFDSLKFVSSSSFLNRQFNNRLDDTYRTRRNFRTSTQLNGDPLNSNFRNDTDLNDFSQEFRLSQNVGSRVSWVAGAYFERRNVHFSQSDPTPGLDALSATFGLPPAAFFGASPDSLFDGNEVDGQSQYAVFGELNFALSPSWHLILGDREFHYKQDTDIRYAGIAQGETSVKQGSTKESGNTPKVELTFTPTEESTLYASATKGFRLGGVTEPFPLGNNFFDQNCEDDLAGLGLTELPTRFRSDTLWSYELGAKTRWLDRSLTVNTSLFDIEWKNIQTNVFFRCGTIAVLNVGKARSRGAELEASWAPIRSLIFNVTGAFTDATLRKKTSAIIAQVGDRVPNVPRFSGSASTEFRHSLDSDSAFYVRGVFSYIGSSFDEFQSLPNVSRVPVNASVDAAVGLTLARYDFSVYAKNLTNRLNVTSVDPDRRVPTTYGVAPPRTIGAEVRLRF